MLSSKPEYPLLNIIHLRQEKYIDYIVIKYLVMVVKSPF